jgi:ATP-binding cassette subfamily F protein 3
MDARDVLTEALSDYDGSLLFVSHDRLFIQALATRVVEITPGDGQARVRSFGGGYAEYEATVEREEYEADQASRPVKKPAPAPAAKSAKPRAVDKSAQRKLRDKATALEREIEATEAAIARLDWLVTEPDVAKDGDRMREIASERREQQQKLDDLYPKWESLTAELD